jgi:hypothetical protein
MERQIDNPNPIPLGLVVKKGSKTIDSRPRTAHRDQDLICSPWLGADRRVPGRITNQAHRFDSVQDQLQQDLLQLNPIPRTWGNRPAR